MGALALLLLAVGLVLSLEGLVFALAPSRIDDLLEAIRQLPVETRRNLGIAAVALGLALIWLSGGITPS